MKRCSAAYFSREMQLKKQWDITEPTGMTKDF